MKINEKLIPKLKDIDVNTQNISNITGKILWTNPNPQAISTATTITLNSSDYDMYEIMYSYSANISSNTLLSTGRIKKGNNTRLQFSYAGNGSVQLRDREITCVSDTSLTIGVNIGTDTLANTLIPRYIIGYKLSTF